MALSWDIREKVISMEMWEGIQSRRSISHLEGYVDEEVVRALIEEAAIWAPNHHHTEPWHFSVLIGESRKRIGDEWARLAADELGLTGEAREKFETKERDKLLRAPVVVVVSQKVSGSSVQVQEDHAAVAAAIQNFLLAAHARGLGARWRTGKMAYHPWLREILKLGAQDVVVGLIYLGWPSSNQEIVARPRTKEGLIDWIIR
ncbi:MAG: nitroreductase [Sulfobacillus benefaciens]|uniref:Putative NAD(P)H nitroreductase n=1 Tax=Sulfobacillus benefaciens TaxID=453960 RepID=A0A2T2WVS0_9FIRM|nr:MAG: nitroreductase [Sulfobacillus benefaciens]